MIETFVLAVATSTVCATLINQSIVQWREYAGRREASRLSALYAANALERYCEECSTRLGEKDDFSGSGGHAGHDWSSLPDLPEYPAEIDWKRLSIRFTERMFEFRTSLAQMGNRISAHYEFDPPDGGDRDVLEQLSVMGIEAVWLAREIRTAYRLKSMPPNAEYSSERHLLQSQERHRERHRLYLEGQAQSRAALAERIAKASGAPDAAATDNP